MSESGFLHRGDLGDNCDAAVGGLIVVSAPSEDWQSLPAIANNRRRVPIRA
jgi:hypothetical protein